MAVDLDSLRRWFPGFPIGMKRPFLRRMLLTKTYVKQGTVCRKCKHDLYFNAENTVYCPACAFDTTVPPLAQDSNLYVWKTGLQLAGPSQWMVAYAAKELYVGSIGVEELRETPVETFAQRAFAAYLLYEGDPELAIVERHIRPAERDQWYPYLDYREDHDGQVPEWAMPFPSFLECCKMNAATSQEVHS